MAERVKRELLLAASVEEVWEAVTGDGWLADEVVLDLRPGGEATFRSAGAVRTGWIEDVAVPGPAVPGGGTGGRARLAFWWEADGEPASRVELTVEALEEATRLRIVETRPLELLDLVGVPLPGTGGASFGPALHAGEASWGPALVAA